MRRLAVAILLTVFGAGMSDSVFAQDRPQSVRKVGILAHRGDEAAVQRWQPTMDAVAEALSGYRFEVVPLSLDGVRMSLTGGEIDYLFTNPGHLYRLTERFRLSPIVALRTDRHGANVTGNRFGAVIFVHADNDEITTLADVKGAKLAAVAPDAFGGFEIAADTLVRNGVDPWRDIGSVAFLGFPQERIVDAVLSGTADVGTVRTGILEAVVMAGKAEAGEIRVLNALRVPGFELALSTDLVPEWILSSTANVPEPERRDVAVALLRLRGDHPAVKEGNYGGWTTVPSDAGVRRILQTVDAAKLGTGTVGAAAVSAYVAISGLVFLVAGLLIASRLRRRAIDSSDGPTAGSGYGAVRLTPRESQILVLVGNGMTTKEIARDLGISPKTVEFHRGHLMRKYDASNMAELIRKADSHRLVAGNSTTQGYTPGNPD